MLLPFYYYLLGSLDNFKKWKYTDQIAYQKDVPELSLYMHIIRIFFPFFHLRLCLDPEIFEGK